MSKQGHITRMTMLTFPEKTFPLPPRTCPRSGFVPEQTSCARALCEDIRHFLSEASINEQCLCEDFPKKLFGVSPASESAEKSFSMQMFAEHLYEKANLFLWRFEGIIQKMRVSTGRLRLKSVHDKGTILSKKRTTFGVELKMGTGRCLYPTRRMVAGSGPETFFLSDLAGSPRRKRERIFFAQPSD